MEIVQSQDQFTVTEGKPSKVTDYKLSFPEDFRKIQKPELSFSTDENYINTSFRIISGQIVSDIDTLRDQKKAGKNLEYALVEINNGTRFYQTKTILTGESGIGFQVTPKLPVNDFIHTHTTHKGEEERSADLFSAFDLWSVGAKGAERYWLIGKDVVWTLVNLYGQRHYHYIKDACWEMAKKYDPKKPYNVLLSDLVECVRKCEYRLYRSDNSTDYLLIS